jgi:hypothetical protein
MRWGSCICCRAFLCSPLCCYPPRCYYRYCCEFRLLIDCWFCDQVSRMWRTRLYPHNQNMAVEAATMCQSKSPEAEHAWAPEPCTGSMYATAGSCERRLGMLFTHASCTVVATCCCYRALLTVMTRHTRSWSARQAMPLAKALRGGEGPCGRCHAPAGNCHALAVVLARLLPLLPRNCYKLRGLVLCSVDGMLLSALSA